MTDPAVNEKRKLLTKCEMNLTGISKVKCPAVYLFSSKGKIHWQRVKFSSTNALSHMDT